MLTAPAFSDTDLQGQPEFPAGSGTTSDISINAFSHPLENISIEEKRSFFVGKSFFRDVWVKAPSSTAGRDGLGPSFNANSCIACHTRDGRGLGLGQNNVDFSLLFRLSVKKFDDSWAPHPAYGGQLNPFGIEDGIAEANAQVSFENVNGFFNDNQSYQLRKPIYSFINLNFGEISSETNISARVAPQVIGLGLLEAISETDLLKLEDPNDSNQDGISGIAKRVTDLESNTLKIGRFGWKAEQPTLQQQNAAAFLGDIGITSRLFPNTNCTSVQTLCLQMPHGEEPELANQLLNRVTTYVQLLSVPKRRDFSDQQVITGEKIFKQINCTACHQPVYRTAATAAFNILSNQNIFPYTDLLLHDMGEELSDQGQKPDRREWRTPPLWGLGLITTVNGHSNLLHDGRARTVEEAILWHGGEGSQSRDNYKSLSFIERQNLLKFLNSL